MHVTRQTPMNTGEIQAIEAKRQALLGQFCAPPRPPCAPACMRMVSSRRPAPISNARAHINEANTGRNTSALQAGNVGRPQRMEVHPMSALVREWNSCRLEVRANHFHWRHSFREHYIFRLKFSGGFQLLQFRHQFRMQRTRLFFAILDEGSG
jgi:hypothetical protein